MRWMIVSGLFCAPFVMTGCAAEGTAGSVPAAAAAGARGYDSAPVRDKARQPADTAPEAGSDEKKSAP